MSEDKKEKERTSAEQFPDEPKTIPPIPGAPRGLLGAAMTNGIEQMFDVMDRIEAEAGLRVFRQAYMHGVPSAAPQPKAEGTLAGVVKNIKWPRRFDM